MKRSFLHTGDLPAVKPKLMATGTTQLLPSKQAGYASSSDEEVEGESLPIIPVPVKDGLPQVSKQLHSVCVRVCVRVCELACLLVVVC